MPLWGFISMSIYHVYIFLAIGSDGEINIRINHILLETENSGLLYEEALYPLVPLNGMMVFIA